MPERMPSIDVVRSEVQTGELEWIGNAQDKEMTVDAYQKPHTIDAQIDNKIIDLISNEYYVTVRSEHGLHALGGMTYIGVRHHCAPST